MFKHTYTCTIFVIRINVNRDVSRTTMKCVFHCELPEQKYKTFMYFPAHIIQQRVSVWPLSGHLKWIQSAVFLALRLVPNVFCYFSMFSLSHQFRHLRVSAASNTRSATKEICENNANDTNEKAHKTKWFARRRRRRRESGRSIEWSRDNKSISNSLFIFFFCFDFDGWWLLYSRNLDFLLASVTIDTIQWCLSIVTCSATVNNTASNNCWLMRSCVCRWRRRSEYDVGPFGRIVRGHKFSAAATSKRFEFSLIDAIKCRHTVTLQRLRFHCV